MNAIDKILSKEDPFAGLPLADEETQQEWRKALKEINEELIAIVPEALREEKERLAHVYENMHRVLC